MFLDQIRDERNGDPRRRLARVFSLRKGFVGQAPDVWVRVDQLLEPTARQTTEHEPELRLGGIQKLSATTPVFDVTQDTHLVSRGAGSGFRPQYARTGRFAETPEVWKILGD